VRVLLCHDFDEQRLAFTILTVRAINVDPRIEARLLLLDFIG
jgi:hypothetical protein